MSAAVTPKSQSSNEALPGFFRKLREPVSGLTHLLGAALGVAALVAMVISAASRGTARHVVSVAIYGASLVTLYLASSIYHLTPTDEAGVRRLRRFDHMAIFVLIAGTYTPFYLITLQGAWGWSLFGVVWGLAVAGIILKIAWMGAPRKLTAGIYVAMGWVVIVALKPLYEALPGAGLFWLIAGGLAYSGGAVIYALKRPNPWPKVFGFHEIWHLFVMAGSFCHFWGIYVHVLP